MKALQIVLAFCVLFLTPPAYSIVVPSTDICEFSTIKQFTDADFTSNSIIYEAASNNQGRVFFGSYNHVSSQNTIPFISTADTSSWQVSFPATGDYLTTSIAPYPFGNTIFLELSNRTNNTQDIYVSLDNGTTWTLGRTDAVSGKRPIKYTYPLSGSVIKTLMAETPSGKVYELGGSPSNLIAAELATLSNVSYMWEIASFSDGNTFIAGSDSGSQPVIWKNKSGFTQWQKTVISGAGSGVVHAVAKTPDNGLVAAISKSDGKVAFAQSTDGGTTWTGVFSVTDPALSIKSAYNASGAYFDLGSGIVYRFKKTGADFAANYSKVTFQGMGGYGIASGGAHSMLLPAFTPSRSIGKLQCNSVPSAAVNWQVGFGPNDYGYYANIGDEVTMDASISSDTENDSLSFSWSQLEGPNVNIVGANTSTPKVTPTQAGDYYFEVSVSDNGVPVVGPSTALVHLQAVSNNSPTANAGTDTECQINQVCILNGSGDDAEDGSDLSIEWSQISGPALSWDFNNIYPGKFTPLAYGSYVLRLTVTDQFGATGSDDVIINVNDPNAVQNSSPLANAGTDHSGVVGKQVSLDGTTSSDPDGDALSFEWSFVPSNNITEPLINNANSALANFTPSEEGDYTFRLTVSDAEQSSQDDVIIHVAPQGEASCGDGICDVSENESTCAADCIVDDTIDSTGGTDANITNPNEGSVGKGRKGNVEDKGDAGNQTPPIETEVQQDSVNGSGTQTYTGTPSSDSDGQGTIDIETIILLIIGAAVLVGVGIGIGKKKK